MQKVNVAAKYLQGQSRKHQHLQLKASTTKKETFMHPEICQPLRIPTFRVPKTKISPADSADVLLPSIVLVVTKHGLNPTTCSLQVLYKTHPCHSSRATHPQVPPTWKVPLIAYMQNKTIDRVLWSYKNLKQSNRSFLRFLSWMCLNALQKSG